MRRAIIGLAVAAMLLPCVALAQEDAGTLPMVWLRYYKAKPGMADEFSAQIEKQTKPLMEGLMADGTLIDWGAGVPFTIQSDDWTHAIWFVMPDWGSADGVVAALAKSQAESSEEEAMAFENCLEPYSRRDVVLRHVAVAGSGPPTVPIRYGRLAYYKARPGAGGDVNALYKEYAQPLYTKLMDEGAIGPAGMSTQDMVSDSSWTHMTWYFTENLAQISTVRDAFNAAQAARSEEEQKQLTDEFQKLLDPDGFHSEVIRLLHVGLNQ